MAKLTMFIDNELTMYKKDVLHIDTIKQKVADYISQDKHGFWPIGPNHHPDHNNIIYKESDISFSLGGIIADINTLLDMCYRSDIEMFAIDYGIIDLEEVA
jgi:hypothetical protein